MRLGGLPRTGDGERFTVTYDADDNPTSQVDSQGRRVEMGYFGTGQLLGLVRAPDQESPIQLPPLQRSA